MQGKGEYKPHHSKPLVSYTLCFISIQMCKGNPTDGSSPICLLVDPKDVCRLRDSHCYDT